MKRLILSLAILFLATDVSSTDAGLLRSRRLRLCEPCPCVSQPTANPASPQLPKRPTYDELMGIDEPPVAEVLPPTVGAPAITVTLDDGTVTITGGPGNDHVLIRQSATKLAIASRGVMLTTYDSPGIKQINADLGEGVNFADAHGVRIPFKLTGSATTYNASLPAPGGLRVEDVNQRNSDDCGHHAALAGAIQAGWRPTFEYAGPSKDGANYLVRTGNRSNLVFFNGLPQAMDPAQRRPGVFWPQLEHRAYRAYWTARGGPGTGRLQGAWTIVDLKGGGEMAQLNVKGFVPTVRSDEIPENRARIWNMISTGLAQKKIVIVDTCMPPGPWYGVEVPPFRVQSPYLVRFHTYTVMKVYNGPKGQMIQLRNPWGKDNYTTKTSGDPDDGLIDLPFEDAIRSITLGVIG